MPMLPTLPMVMASLMPMQVFPSAPAVDLTLSPRELPSPTWGILDSMDTTLARGLLMPMLMLSMLPSHTLPLSLMPEFLLDPALVLTPSPRDLMLPPRDMPPILDTLDTMDTTLARGLLTLKLMLMLSMLPTHTPPLLLMQEFLLAPALVSTPSPRVLMLPPRDMPPSMDTLATMDTTLARGLLMLKLMLMLSMLPTPMLPQSPMLMPEFPLDPALVLTPSPRVLMPPPRDMPPTLDTPLATMPASKLESLL